MREIYEVLIRGVLDALSIEYTQELNRFSFLYDGCHRYAYVKTDMTALEEGIQTDFYHPLRFDVNEAEDAIYSRDLTDVTDILKEMLKDEKKNRKQG